ncbi:hypothetical protein CLPU_6c00510 [Gottschalkia purinilytica]|uniref:Phage tail fibre protein N-terminal domain-containing protein n=1 Tax=Gottschalkia purinilytica TaxID=1503 RepID=A0A0L0WB59_GOTPU|nr:phage tail protein [Gottschalkia purinilytica]KNF08565.1 hypothetical protein CLPU_6c00510 [Gottschalkia purinilytica]
MAKFNRLVLTKEGIDLQSKVQIGLPLKFTKVGIGDGLLTDGKRLDDLKELINRKKIYDINKLKVIGDGTSKVTTIISNKDIEEGFYVREIGLFAEDPDKGEILYCVANAGEYADFLPSHEISPVEFIIELITIVGNAENVTAVINDSLVFVTREELNDLAGAGRTTETVKKNADDILMLAIELAILKNATLNNFTHNIFVVNFEEIKEDELLDGYYDEVNKRLVI